MSFSSIDNDKIMFSVVDDNIIDDQGRKYYAEVKITKSFFRKLLSQSKNNLILDLKKQCCVTKREIQVLSYLAEGMNNLEIAERLNVSVSTAKAHIQNIFKKMGVTDRTEAVVKAIKVNLIDI